MQTLYDQYPVMAAEAAIHDKREKIPMPLFRSPAEACVDQAFAGMTS